jgi:hypothetical protein
MCLYVVDSEGIDPKTRRLLRAYPDLVNHLRDACMSTKISNVPLTTLLPLWSVGYSTFTTIPIDLKLWMVLEYRSKILIVRV